MATKSKKDGGQRYDWNLIMTDYVTNSDSSLRKIAEKYGIRFPTVQQKAKADSWFATKQEYQKEVRTKALSKACTKKANELVGLVTISDHIEKAILKAIENDPLYFYKHIISENLNEKDAELSILNVKAMKDMMRVVKDVEDVKRSINEIKRQDQRIAAERLQLEKDRFEFEKQKAEILKPDSTNSIRIEGFEKGWSE